MSNNSPFSEEFLINLGANGFLDKSGKLKIFLDNIFKIIKIYENTNS